MFRDALGRNPVEREELRNELALNPPLENPRLLLLEMRRPMFLPLSRSYHR